MEEKKYVNYTLGFEGNLQVEQSEKQSQSPEDQGPTVADAHAHVAAENQLLVSRLPRADDQTSDLGN